MADETSRVKLFENRQNYHAMFICCVVNSLKPLSFEEHKKEMDKQMDHRGLSLIELCPGLKLKVAISCLLKYYIHLVSGHM